MEFNRRDVEVTTYSGDAISEKTVRFQHIPTGICIEVKDRSQHKAYTRGMLEIGKLVSDDRSIRQGIRQRLPDTL